MAWLTAASALLTTLGTAPARADSAWQKVGGDVRSGVSGSRTRAVPRADQGWTCWPCTTTRGPGQKRLSRITHWEGAFGISPITWAGPEPVDLEAIEAIPGMPGEYLALTGRGIVYRLKVAGSKATVVDYSPLPGIGEGDDFESFALVSQNGILAVLWADRGAGADRPATLYAALRGVSRSSAPSRAGRTRPRIRPATAPGTSPTSR
ncbi:hypothetical protein [Streptomyces phaeochromogenes]|uniref:hypothetical protein n=1 Tax=Streptomyces phaeochromogenes TaxID=1923 RepID=UPI0033CF1BF5